MPLRLPCQRVKLSPGNILYPYWGPQGFHRPAFDVFLVIAGGVIARATPHLDSGADHTLFSSTIAQALGLSLPFPRHAAISGAGGTYTGNASFPPDGLVSLFVTDYRGFCYLPGPLVGFHAPGPSSATQRSVLGLSGFLQYFRLVLEPSPALVELHPVQSFPGTAGALPVDRPLHDFIADLRGAA